ncbi:MAG: hypothetical protein ACP6KW_06095 [Candidatus Thorarchaeota archaeon]
MPKAIFSIWWDDNLGPMVGRSYPEDEVLSSEEAITVFMGHGVNQEAEVGYSKLQKGLIISYMRPPACIAVLLDEGEEAAVVERNLKRLVPHINFDSDSWDNELKRAYHTLNELMSETSGDQLLANPGVKRLIQDLVTERIPAIVPKHILKAAVTYPEARDYLGNDDEEITRLLDDLEDAGVLESRTYGRRVECRQCGDSNLIIELQCPKCGSTNLHNVYSVFCPRCSTQFHTVIVDDLAEVTCLHCKSPVKVSELAILDVEPLCSDCGTASADPKIVFKCATCGKQMKAADLLAGTGLSYRFRR